MARQVPMTPTPTLAAIIEAAIEKRLDKLFVCLPGMVIKYKHVDEKLFPSAYMAEVQPLLKYNAPGQGVYLLPIITNVPILFPRSTTAYLDFPIAPGDLVTLFFADKSLDKYLRSGGETDPQDTRLHYVNDAFAFPGGYPFSTPIPGANNDMIRLGLNDGTNIANILIDPGTADVTVETTGKINLGDDTADNVAIKDINSFIEDMIDELFIWINKAAIDTVTDEATKTALITLLKTYLSTKVRIG